jgi:hypothetical protein
MTLVELLTKYNATNRGVAWLIKRGFRISYWNYSLNLQATKYYNHLTQFLQQLLNNACSSLNASESNWNNSPSWRNQMARLATLLTSNSNCLLWAATGPSLELPIDCWTTSHYSIELILTVLSWTWLKSVLICGLQGLAWSGFAWIAKRLPMSPSLKRDCCLVTAATLIRNEPEYVPTFGYFEIRHNIYRAPCNDKERTK